MVGARCAFLLILVAAFEGVLMKALPGTEVGDVPAQLKADAMGLPKGCKDKFFSATSPPTSDPDEMRTYIVLLQRYATSRTALRVASTLQRLARTEHDTSGVRMGELSVMSSGEPSLVVETTVAGVRVLCQFSDVALIEEDQIAVSESAQKTCSEQSPDHEVPYHLDRIDQRHPPLDGIYRPDGNGSGVEIFVLDSGIRYDHTEFGGRALFSGYDPVDELLSETQRGRDCFGHGTSVASIAVGRHLGTAPGAIVRSIRVMTCQGTGLLSRIYKGLLWMIEQKEKQKERKMIASMSIIVSTGRSPSLDSAVKRVHLAGIPVVVAAGNFRRDACLYSPAASPYAISVGGSTSDDKIFDWNVLGSNYGPCVDVFAPATNIKVANSQSRNCWTHSSGTSFSTPIISGLVAILLEREPHLNATQVMQRIKEDCTKGALIFTKQRDQDGTPNCLAYTSQRVTDVHKHAASEINMTSMEKNSKAKVEVVDKSGQDNETHNDDKTHTGDKNQTSDSTDHSSNDDQGNDDGQMSDKDALGKDDQKNDEKQKSGENEKGSDDEEVNDKDQLWSNHTNDSDTDMKVDKDALDRNDKKGDHDQSSNKTSDGDQSSDKKSDSSDQDQSSEKGDSDQSSDKKSDSSDQDQSSDEKSDGDQSSDKESDGDQSSDSSDDDQSSDEKSDGDQSSDKSDGEQSSDEKSDGDQSSDKESDGVQPSDKRNGDQSSDTKSDGDQPSDKSDNDQSSDRKSDGDQSSDKGDGNQTSDKGDGDQSSDEKSNDHQSGERKSDTDEDHNPKASTEIPDPTPVPTPNKAEQTLGPSYVANVSILASELQPVLLKYMEDGYLPIYVSNVLEPSTGRLFSVIAIFKRTPWASDCKMFVDKRSRKIHKQIKATKKDGYVPTLLHSYVAEDGKLRLLAVLEPKEFALNFTSRLQYKVKPAAVDATIRKMSALGYTIGSMSSAVCGRVKPVFTLFSEHFGPEKHLNLPNDPFVLLMDIDDSQVVHKIIDYRQKGFYIKDVAISGGCGNGAVPVEAKYSLLFGHMGGASTGFTFKLHSSSVPSTQVEDYVQDRVERFQVKPVMVAKLGKYYITQFAPL